MPYVLSEQPVRQQVAPFYQQPNLGTMQSLLEIPAAGEWSKFAGAVVVFLAIGVGVAVFIARIGNNKPR